MFLVRPVWKGRTRHSRAFASVLFLITPPHPSASNQPQPPTTQAAKSQQTRRTRRNHQEPTDPPITDAFSLLQPQPRYSPNLPKPLHHRSQSAITRSKFKEKTPHTNPLHHRCAPLPQLRFSTSLCKSKKQIAKQKRNINDFKNRTNK